MNSIHGKETSSEEKLFNAGVVAFYESLQRCYLTWSGIV